MDRTVPLAAARMLDFVRATEVGTDGPSGYNVIYGFNQDKLPVPITQMTIDQVLAAQSSFTRRFGSSATGAYQFMRATLTDLKRELGLRGTQVLDPDLQDRLAYHLLKRRGYEAYMRGALSRTEFGKRLAQEWASFPVLADTRGAHRQISRGQSYYAGDGLNKALVSPEAIERVLDDMKELGDAMPAQIEAAEPKLETPTYEEPAMPSQPANPRPDLTPVEQSNKAVGAGSWTAVAGALWTVLVGLDVLPAEVNTPEVATAVLTIVGALAAAVGAYRARDKRFQTGPAS